MFTVTNLDKFIGGRTLLQGASFQLGAGERVCLVGANGSGKSTLLKILAGATSKDGGQIALPRDTTLGYLPQHAELDTPRTLLGELRHVFKDVLSHEAELDELAHKMGELDPSGAEYEAVADRFGTLHHEIERLGAYDMDARIGRVTAGLGFNAADLERPCSQFSGGWRMRILLARLLLRNPDVMLLDEPTNHLDLETMIWLEDWIKASDASVVLVSHERAFMDNLAERTFEIHEGQLTIYKGNYSYYLNAREERWAQWAREYENQKIEIERIQSFVDRFRYKATKAVQVQSRIKQLEKIVRILPPPSEPGAIHFKFPEPDRGSKEVFVGEGLGMSFGDHHVLSDINFAIYRGERVALVGLNGAGKSTLMKLMISQLTATAGTLRQGTSTTTEYFAQYETENLAPSNTVFNEVASVAPLGSDQQVRNLLGGFFFRGDDVEKKIEVLSGGERTRVRLAKMLFSGANTLLLDEPTNHLDLASRKTLEDAMSRFPGTVIFVSHDRVFLERVPTRILEIKDGGLRSFEGNYIDYCRALAARGETSPLVGKSTAPAGPALTSSNFGKTKGSDAVKGAQDDSASEVDSNLSWEERKELQRQQRRIQKVIDQLEKDIAQAEKKLAQIDEQMMLPGVYTNPKECARLGGEQRQLRTQIEQAYAQWEAQQENLAELVP